MISIRRKNTVHINRFISMLYLSSYLIHYLAALWRIHEGNETVKNDTYWYRTSIIDIIQVVLFLYAYIH